MKKLISTIVLFSLASGISCVASPIRTVTTISPLPALNNIGNYQYDNYPKVTQLEQLVFGQTYLGEDIVNRISRLESRVFNRVSQNMDLSQRVDILSAQISPASIYNIPENQLAAMEMKLFNRVYGNDDPETRVIRLEKEMLGAVQQGDLKERFNVVAQAAKHYNAFPAQDYNYNGNSNALLPQYLANANTGTGKGNIFKNILSMMAGGALTGFTPPISDPYGYCSSPYMNTPYGLNRNTWGQQQNLFPGSNGAGFNNYNQSNTGYYNYNKNYGTGSGVNVLYD